MVLGDMNFNRIKIDDILLSNRHYALVPDFFPTNPDEPILDSIKRVGILHPPIIKETNTGDLIVVNGRKRLLAASKLQHQTCTCLQLDPDLPELSTWLIALEDALLTGTINPIQQAVFLVNIKKICDNRQISNILSRMGLSPSARIIKQKEKLLQLEEDLQLAIWQENLNEKTGLELTKLTSSDRGAIFDIIMKLNLSASNQKKLTAIGRELSMRKSISIEEVFTNRELKEIINHPEANIPQKAKMFMTLLERLRFPQLKGAEDEFNIFVNELKLPANIRVSHAQAFEKDQVDLTITCSNRNELKDIVNQL